MRVVKTWRGKPDIMNEDIKDMLNWNRKFGEGFATGLTILFILAFIMFFYEGCSWRELNGPDNILNPKEEEKVSNPHVFLHNDFDAAAWILYK